MQREPVPHKGVRIFRDRFNVPHIYGKTNDDVTWGAGWALAAGPRAAARAGPLQRARRRHRRTRPDRDRPDRRPQDLPAERADRARAAKEVDKLKRYGKPGRRLLHDMRVYVKGINAYYRKEHGRNKAPSPGASWT